MATTLARYLWSAYFVVMICRLLRVPFKQVLPWKYLGRVAAVCAVATGASLVAKIPSVTALARLAERLGLPPVRGEYELWIMLARFVAGGIVFAAVFVPLALRLGIFPELERHRLLKLWRAVSGWAKRALSWLGRPFAGRRQ